jgi:SulP family sulfate permease
MFVASTLLLLPNTNSETKIMLLYLLTCIAWIIQVVFWLLKWWSLLQYISKTVITAYGLWIAILIIWNQLKNFFGLSFAPVESFLWTMWQTILHLPSIHRASWLVGIASMTILLTLQHYFAKWPNALIAILCMTAITRYFDLDIAYHIKTIWVIPHQIINFSIPELRKSISMSNINQIIWWALWVALLWIIESSSIAKTIALQSKEKINPNKEFIAQWLANISASMISGMPGSGSFTRSALNFNSWAQSRIAGICTGCFVALLAYLGNQIIYYIPVASLAWVLMVIAYRMIDWNSLLYSYKATLRDKKVLIITFGATMLFSLQYAIFIWVAASMLFFIQRITAFDIHEIIPTRWWNWVPHNTQTIPYPLLQIIQIKWSIFFGDTEELHEALQSVIRKDAKVVILKLKYVRTIDASGAELIANIFKIQIKKWWSLIISWANHAIQKVLKNVWLYTKIGEKQFVRWVDEAIDLAFTDILDSTDKEKAYSH